MRVVVLGDRSVGKTALISAFFRGNSGPDFGSEKTSYEKIVYFRSKYETLQVIDSPNPAEYSFGSNNGIIIVYSIDNRASFENIPRIMQAMRLKSRIPVIICGNKADICEGRKVSYEEGLAMSLEIASGFFETSASNGTNVTRLFETVSHQIKPTICKVIVLGVGKSPGVSSLIERIASNTFDSINPRRIASGADRAEFFVDSTLFIVRGISSSSKRAKGAYLRTSRAALIVYDITQPFPADEIAWLTSNARSYPQFLPTVLVGTKSDMSEMVTAEGSLGKNFAIGHSLDYVEVSSKTGKGVREIFERLSLKIQGNDSQFESPFMNAPSMPMNMIGKHLFFITPQSLSRIPRGNETKIDFFGQKFQLSEGELLFLSPKLFAEVASSKKTEFFIQSDSPLKIHPNLQKSATELFQKIISLFGGVRSIIVEEADAPVFCLLGRVLKNRNIVNSAKSGPFPLVFSLTSSIFEADTLKKDFAFKVCGKSFSSPIEYARVLSGNVSKILSCDSSCSHFCFDCPTFCESSDYLKQFSEVLSILDGEGLEVTNENAIIIAHIASQVGASELLEFASNVYQSSLSLTVSNVLPKLRCALEVLPTASLSVFVEFITLHFYEFSIDALGMIRPDIIDVILNKLVRVGQPSPQTIFDVVMASHVYHGPESNKLLRFLRFDGLKNESIVYFFKNFSGDEIGREAWESIGRRIINGPSNR